MRRTTVTAAFQASDVGGFWRNWMELRTYTNNTILLVMAFALA